MKVLLMMLTMGLMMGSGCTSVDPDEQALKALAEHFASSVERGDKAAFKAVLHLDYADRFGHDRKRNLVARAGQIEDDRSESSALTARQACIVDTRLKGIHVADL